MPFFARVLKFPVVDPHRLEVRPAHRAFVAECVARGEIVMSGPFVGDEGALMVFQVADRPAVEALIAQDPYTTEGVAIDAELHEWTVTTPLP
ncbi:MAG: hypothetical protein H7287_02840 [Thermoleophilia bacterium]|nr:hypothetical protein [Thermoleophilia bacterium]